MECSHLETLGGGDSKGKCLALRQTERQAGLSVSVSPLPGLLPLCLFSSGCLFSPGMQAMCGLPASVDSTRLSSQPANQVFRRHQVRSCKKSQLSMSPGIRVEPAGHTGQAFSFSRSQLWGLNPGQPATVGRPIENTWKGSSSCPITLVSKGKR